MNPPNNTSAWVQMTQKMPVTSRGVAAAAFPWRNQIALTGCSGLCHTFNVGEKTWQELPPLKVERYFCGTVFYQNRLYVMGGWDSRQKVLDSMEMLQFHSQGKPSQQEWEKRPSMGTKREGFGTAIINGIIYVVGGYDGSHCLDAMEAFHQEENRWVPLPNMAERRSGCAAVAIKECLYVFGGHNGNKRLNTGEMFDSKTNTWRPLPNMPRARSALAAAVVGEKIYILGGNNNSKNPQEVDVFDTAMMQWRTRHPFPRINTGRVGCGFVFSYGKLLMLGGVDQNNNILDTIETTEVTVSQDNCNTNDEQDELDFLLGGIARKKQQFLTRHKLSDDSLLNDEPPQDDEIHEQKNSNADHNDTLATGTRTTNTANAGDTLGEASVGGHHIDNQERTRNVDDGIEGLVIPTTLLPPVPVAKTETQPNTTTKTTHPPPYSSTTPAPDYSEFETRASLVAEIVRIKTACEEYEDEFDPEAILRAKEAHEKLPRLGVLLSEMPTVDDLKAKVSHLENEMRRLRSQNEFDRILPLATERKELLQQLQKEEAVLGDDKPPPKSSPPSAPTTLPKPDITDSTLQEEAPADAKSLVVFGKNTRAIKLLKESGQAKVYFGFRRVKNTHHEVAIKMFDGEDAWEDECQDELRNFLRIPVHPNVMEILAFFQVPFPAYVMKYIRGGDLRDYLDSHGKFDLDDAKMILVGIANGLDHLHRNGVIHRDVKSPNIMLEQLDDKKKFSPVLIDLGLGKMLGENHSKVITTGVKGSFRWMAPEMNLRKEWSAKSDMYALGIIMWEILTGETPFGDFSDSQVIAAVSVGGRPDLDLLEEVGITKEQTKLVNALWDKAPKKRPSASEFLVRMGELFGPNPSPSTKAQVKGVAAFNSTGV